MLDYKIDIPETLFPVSILKMILQPLIRENAVYHGTKYVRHKGFIRITACKIDEMIQFKVIDNGIGIPAEKLAEIRKELAKGIDSDFQYRLRALQRKQASPSLLPEIIKTYHD